MIHEITVVGPFMCNCSILACEKTKEAVIIDPGDEPKRILDVVRSLGVKVKYLIHTHAHLDHIIATGDVKRETGSQVALHEGDQWLYDNLEKQARTFGFDAAPPPKIDLYIKDGDQIKFGEHSLKVIHTPGHTPGSVCFSIDGDETVFTGDTLFCRSIGRTDLWGGSYEQILDSIRIKLLALDNDALVYPGHGPTTHIGDEKKKNPFLR